MTATAIARLCVTGSVVLGLAGGAAAQTSVFGPKIEGEVEVGGRLYIDYTAHIILVALTYRFR